MVSFKQFMESESVFETPLTIDEAMKKIVPIFNRVADMFKGKATKDSSSRAAPDTSKFVAHHSGKIEVGRNVSTGHQSFDLFLKIGTATNVSVLLVAEHIGEEIEEDLDLDFFKTPPSALKCADGKLVFQLVSGTSWGGVGVRTAKS